MLQQSSYCNCAQCILSRRNSQFNRIILKFPKVRRAFKAVRRVFDEFDDDNSGTIDKGELSNCLSALGAEMHEEDIKEMFAGSQMTAQGELDFKEFLVALSLGSVLQLFPSLRAYSSVDLHQLKAEEAARRDGLNPEEAAARAKRESKGGPDSHSPVAPSGRAGVGANTTSGQGHSAGRPGNTRSKQVSDERYKVDTDLPEAQPVASPQASRETSPRAGAASGSAGGDGDGAITHAVTPHTRAKLQQKGRMLVEGLKIVLEAYCLFDQDGSGTIDKDEVLGMIAEASSGGAKRAHGASQGTSAMLSSERWNQLDWDDDGSVTLREFISAFYSWVGLDDDDEMDETETDPEGTVSADIGGEPSPAGGGRSDRDRISLEASAPTPARVPPASAQALKKEQERSQKPRGGAFRKKESWTAGSKGGGGAVAGGSGGGGGGRGAVNMVGVGEATSAPGEGGPGKPRVSFTGRR